MRYVLLILISLAYGSCEDEPVIPTPPAIRLVADIDIVTGINLTDINGLAFGVVGTANDYGNAVVYPNPATSITSIQLLDTAKSILSYAIVPAEQDTSFSTAEVSSFFNGFQGYQVSAINGASTENRQLSTPASTVSLSLSSLPKGFYRLICIAQDQSQHAVAIYINPQSQYPEVVDELFSLW